MLKELYNCIMENGALSSKRNVLSYIKGNPEMVYTKKIVLTIPYKISGCLVKSVSITSQHKDFSDVGPSDVRVNLTNMFDKWVNIYASNLSKVTLDKLTKLVKSLQNG